MKNTIYILIAVALASCSMPTCGFGQSTSGNVTNDAFSTFDSAVPPPFLAPASAPGQASLTPAGSDISLPAAEQFNVQHHVPQPAIPAPAMAEASSVTAAQFPSAQPQSYQSQSYQPPLRQQHVPQQEVAVNVSHPFLRYWGVPNDPQTKIVGKPMTVAQLLTGTRSPGVREQLLRAYWDLSGLLAIYHFRCETERQATSASGRQQDGMAALLYEQRRTAEMEFIKQQWNLAELLRQYKGQRLRESELPIPADFPLSPRFQTFADKIARSERTQYLGRMIPLQEQLIESKNGTWQAASGMDWNLRTMAFLDLTKAIIEYNKMIAEYALETIPSNVSSQQLVRVVVRQSGSGTVLPQAQTPQMAEGITLTHYEAAVRETPMGIPAQPVGQMAYEYQIPALPARSTTPASEAPVDKEVEAASEMMLNF